MIIVFEIPPFVQETLKQALVVILTK